MSSAEAQGAVGCYLKKFDNKKYRRKGNWPTKANDSQCREHIMNMLHDEADAKVLADFGKLLIFNSVTSVPGANFGYKISMAAVQEAIEAHDSGKGTEEALLDLIVGTVAGSVPVGDGVGSEITGAVKDQIAADVKKRFRGYLGDITGDCRPVQMRVPQAILFGFGTPPDPKQEIGCQFLVCKRAGAKDGYTILGNCDYACHRDRIDFSGNTSSVANYTVGNCCCGAKRRIGLQVKLQWNDAGLCESGKGRFQTEVFEK